MPLPQPGTEWPPRGFDCVERDLSRWSAWWSGDPDELTKAYGGYAGTVERSFAQREGGLIPSIARFFWGQPTQATEQRTKLHIPLASEIAGVSADLLFGQPPTISIKDAQKGDPTAARLSELMGEETATQLHEAAEACAALGHVYMRVGWDREVDDKNPLVSVVDADAAYPLYRYGRLVEVTFVREWEMAGSVLRHLELHEKGYIWHAAYLGDMKNLGRVVPLDAHAETADAIVQGMVSDDRRDGSAIPTGIDMLDVVGVANARSRTWRHLPNVRDLGRPDIAGSESELDALDDVWSSWMRDIRHGRSRIHLPNHMLDSMGRGKGGVADLDRELYVGLESPPDGSSPLGIEVSQFKIRWQEHRETTLSLLERIVGGCGYSPQTFGLDSDGTLTATEAWSRQTRTQNTRNGKIRRWRPEIIRLSRVMLAVDRAQFGGKGNPDADIQVGFADTVSESTLSRAQTANTLRAADAASTRTLVEMVHNDWETEQVDKEVAAIMREQSTFAPAPPGFGPNEDDQTPDGTPSAGQPPESGQPHPDDLAQE